MQRLVHLLGGLEIGGKERVALKLARRARRLGLAHELLLFDRDYRDPVEHLDPGDVPCTLLRRGKGLDLRFTAALAGWLERERVEVVHAHNDSALVYGVLAARRAPRRPRVVGTFHTRPSHPTFLGRLLCHWASKRADVVTAVSPDLRRDLVNWGWLARCRVVWNGVDVEEYRPDGLTDGWRERLGVAPGALLVAHVGRFHRVKRQRDLLEAARALRERAPPLHVAFVGLGPELAAFEAEVQGERGISVIPRVHDMAAFYREIDLFVLCSIEEAAPLVLLEAMACARASVTTDAGSMVEILAARSDAPCGRIVPQRQPEALALAIGELASDEHARRELGLRARERAVSEYSEQREWDDYVRLYRGESA